MCLIDISSSSVGFICWASISLATSSSSNDSSFCDKRLLPNIVNQALSEEIQVNLPEIIVQVPDYTQARDEMQRVYPLLAHCCSAPQTNRRTMLSIYIYNIQFSVRGVVSF